jgi:hypothetical protein
MCTGSVRLPPDRVGAFEPAEPLLATPCLVLLDDTHPRGEPSPAGTPLLWGKGARAVPFLLDRDFRLERCDGGQALLSRGSPPST